MTQAPRGTSRPRSSRPGASRPASRRSRSAHAREPGAFRSANIVIERTFGSRANALAAAMLVACMVLGGGGTSNPGTEIALELILSLLVVAAIWWPRGRTATRAPEIPISRAALAITALAIAIPVIQLIPLPPALWHALPGRQPEVAALSLIGQADRWMPWTMAPATTFASLLAIIAELVVFVGMARVDLVGRQVVCWAIVGVAFVSIVLGCLQLSMAGGLTWSIYSAANIGWVLGFQANRNAETDVLQVGIMALAAIMASAGHDRAPWRVSTVIAFALVMIGMALGAVLTGSRAGIALLPLTYVFTVWIAWPVIAGRLSRRAWWIVLLPAAACLLLLPTEQVQHALGRFGGTSDGRWDIWHDTITAIRSVWPLGGGIGSFPVIYDAAQSIERLQPTLDMRAHNDWLEWVLEAGVPGIVVLALIGAIVVACNVRALRVALRRDADPNYRATVLLATGTLLHIGLHGLFDYPIRSMALAALVGSAVALLLPQRGRPLRNATYAPE